VVLVPDIGISTGAYAELPLAQALERIAELASFAEICSWGRHSLLRPENARAVAEAGAPFTVHAPFVHDGSAGLFKSRTRVETDSHRRHMTAAAELWAGLYVVHPLSRRRRDPRDPMMAAAFQHAVDAIRTVQDELGLSVVIENMPFFYPSYFVAPGLLDLQGLGLALDVGHAAISGTLSRWLADPHATLRHVHLHDNLGPAGGDLHMALGAGVIDAAPAVAAARAAGATIVLEHITEADVLASLEHLRARGLLFPETVADESSGAGAGTEDAGDGGGPHDV
jgi:sugar phosphate isomerase/epimerase